MFSDMLSGDPADQHRFPGANLCPYCAVVLLPHVQMCASHTEGLSEWCWAEENRIYCDFLHRRKPWTHYPDMDGDMDAAYAWRRFEDLLEDDVEDRERIPVRAGAVLGTDDALQASERGSIPRASTIYSETR